MDFLSIDKIFIFVIFIGCTNAGSPYISSSNSSAFKSLPENFNGTVCTFHVKDSDSGDSITVKPDSDKTVQYFNIVTHGNGNDVSVDVTVKKPLDRETLGGTVKIELSITDGTNEIYYEFTVYISDVNDNSPLFQNEPYNRNIDELPCNASNVVYTRIHATDEDINENGRIRYSMQPEAQSAAARQRYSETFSINSVSGSITLNKCLDYETNNYYQFTITAKDSGTPSRSSTAVFIIRVKDVQDMPPLFDRDSYRKTINEGLGVVITISARDGDTGVSNKVNYSMINSTCNGIFEINATSGIISTSSALDRDQPPINETGNCILTVETQEIESSNKKNDGLTTANTTVIITVQDIDDNSPNIIKSSYNATVKENTPEDVPIKLITAIFVTDLDQGDNAFMSISLQDKDGNESENFAASPKEIQGSGKIMILVKNATFLDYEKRTNTEIKIVATGKNQSHSDSATLFIGIQDRNDNDPKFNATSFNLMVKENANGAFVGLVTATDKDVSPKFKTLRYSISGGSNRFTVDNNTGIVRTNCDKCEIQLDREKQTDYYMTLFASNVDGSERKSSVVLHVSLIDVNDNKPKFLRPTYTAFIEENHERKIIKLEASDQDERGTKNSEFTFKILGSTEDANFTKYNLTINNTTGELGLTRPVDFEHLKNIEGKVNITVKVTDKGDKPLSSTAVVQLSVQDKNDNKPYFNKTRYSASIAENEKSVVGNKTFVAQVFANDDDVTEQNSKLNYFKIGGSDKFAIDASTGVISIQINSKLDREKEPWLNLTIIAVDQGSPPQTGTTNVLIDVTDVNDEKPTFGENPHYKTAVIENSPEHEIIYTCSATDPDSDHKFYYTITGITAIDENGKTVNETLVNGYFDIFPNNGSVYVNGVPDRETADTIVLTIQVNDTKAVEKKPQTSTATLTITLKDVNDNQPVFSQSYYNISVREDANAGSQLTTIKATDKDINRTITYKLMKGPSPASSFRIDNKTGILTKTGELDRETNSSVTLEVVAVDDGVPSLNSTVLVNVEILDFNDNPPLFQEINQIIHMVENVDNGTTLIDINATDADEGPNKNITFFMDDDKHFAISETTGVIYVIKSPDREETPQIDLRIITKDNPENEKVQKSSFMTLTVIIDDKNDNSPEFDPTEYSARVEEDKDVGSVITRVTATDKDEKNTNNSKITYKLDDTFGDKFLVDRNSGDIKINSSLIDFVGIYRLQLQAYDQGHPQLTGMANIIITVTDKNRHHPKIGNFMPEGNELKIYECTRKGTVIHRFNYTDQDYDQNANASFRISLLQENVTGVFDLTQDGNLTVAGKLDVNQKATYKFGIIATDHGDPNLSSDVLKVTITLIDVNDHSPSFKLPKVTWPLQENTTDNTTIGVVTAFDEDKDSRPCYKIISSEWADNFIVNKTSGRIWNVKPLDHELAASVSFNINVTDCSILKNVSDVCNKTLKEKIENNINLANSSIEVTVDVIDIDDSPPLFKQKQLATGMRRNTEADTELELHLRNESYISDADSPQNGILSWTFSNNGNITISPELQAKIKPNSGAKPCGDGINHIFCVTKNGTIINNKFFSEDLSGYFIVSVKVADKAGYDTADITIYLISDRQIVTMTIRNNKEMVASFKDDLLSKLSGILGYSAVFDSLQDHKENGVVNPHSSDLKFHIVEKESQAVLTGEKAIELFDKQANNGDMINLQNRYNVMRVSQQSMTESDAEASSKKLTFILVAVSVAEALIITIVIFVALSARNKFRRKLKAAVISTPDMEMQVTAQKEVAIPGSNLYSKQNNPLLNADIDSVIQEADVDCKSIASSDDIDLDENDVDDQNTVYDRMEEREVTLDMYNDDTFHSVSSEDLLNATLNLHALRKSRDSLDKIDADDEEQDDSHQIPSTSAAFINEAFSEDLESTEI